MTLSRWPRSSGPTLYVGLVAPEMAVPLRLHCQVSSDVSPSGSESAAVMVSPVLGALLLRLTVPCSSRLLTLMFTVVWAVAPWGSVAVITNVWLAAVSKSSSWLALMAPSGATVNSPLPLRE